MHVNAYHLQQAKITNSTTRINRNKFLDPKRMKYVPECKIIIYIQNILMNEIRNKKLT